MLKYELVDKTYKTKDGETTRWWGRIKNAINGEILWKTSEDYNSEYDARRAFVLLIQGLLQSLPFTEDSDATLETPLDEWIEDELVRVTETDDE